MPDTRYDITEHRMLTLVMQAYDVSREEALEFVEENFPEVEQ